MTLSDLVSIFQKWLWMPDPRPLYAMLGTVAANRLEGDPVWLLLIGPPACGKTELLNTLSDLPDTHSVSTFTEAGLLSGSVSRSPLATGGLLEALGDQGIIVISDLTSVLSERTETRNSLFAALREIFDGAWNRHLGVEGGKTLQWRGKAGLLAGVTEVIDLHQQEMGALGERFLSCRIEITDRIAQGRTALAHSRRQTEMRIELANAVEGFFADFDLQSSAPLTPVQGEWLECLSDFATRARSPLEREAYRDREIELIPSSEAIGRMVQALDQLWGGLVAIGLDPLGAQGIVGKVALDSIPKIRSQVIEVLADQDGHRHTSWVADQINYPTAPVRRALEALAAHGVVERIGTQHNLQWMLTGWAVRRRAEIEHGPQPRPLRLPGLNPPQPREGVSAMSATKKNPALPPVEKGWEEIPDENLEKLEL